MKRQDEVKRLRKELKMEKLRIRRIWEKENPSAKKVHVKIPYERDPDKIYKDWTDEEVS